MHAMQDRMILVQPAEQGWSVTLEGQQLSALPTRSQAVESATGHAGDRFAITGEPIGVVLRLACGSEVLICQHERPSTKAAIGGNALTPRSEEHTSELQSLMRISYAVLCLQ